MDRKNIIKVVTIGIRNWITLYQSLGNYYGWTKYNITNQRLYSSGRFTWLVFWFIRII